LTSHPPSAKELHYANLKEEGLTTLQLRDIGRIAAVVNAADLAIAAGEASLQRSDGAT
jgi:alkylhydroperoxidase family enzyme